MSNFETCLICDNESFIRVETNNESVFDILDKNYVFEVPGYRFMPSYKSGRWDGKNRLFDRKKHTIYRGLLGHIYKTLKNSDVGDLSVDGYVKPDDVSDEFMTWLAELDLPFKPYQYQIDAALKCLNAGRKIVLSPTSSGKSLIFYLIVRFLIDSGRAEKTLFVVPRTMLVDQIIENFDEFGAEEGFIKKLNCGESKIVATTWQSCYKNDSEFFNQFDCVCVDEVHTASADSIKGIMEKATRVPYRFGMTGTLSDSKVDKLVIIGLFGSVYKTVTTKALMDSGIVASLRVIMSRIDYSKLRHIEPNLFDVTLDYDSEIKLVLSSKRRDDVIISRLEEYSDKNVICLYRYNKHGIRFFERFKERCPDREVYLINGDVPNDGRVRIQKRIDECVDSDRGVVLVASFGTLSTGVSIKNLDVGALISPIKSKISLLQSVGRILRISSSKDSALLIDFWDDIRFKKSTTSYCRKHAQERLTKYTDEKFSITEEGIEL